MRLIALLMVLMTFAASASADDRPYAPTTVKVELDGSTVVRFLTTVKLDDAGALDTKFDAIPGTVDESGFAIKFVGRQVGTSAFFMTAGGKLVKVMVVVASPTPKPPPAPDPTPYPVLEPPAASPPTIPPAVPSVLPKKAAARPAATPPAKVGIAKDVRTPNPFVPRPSQASQRTHATASNLPPLPASDIGQGTTAQPAATSLPSKPDSLATSPKVPTPTSAHGTVPNGGTTKVAGSAPEGSTCTTS